MLKPKSSFIKTIVRTVPRERWVVYFNIILFIVVLILNLSQPTSLFRWEGYPDYKDYVNQSKTGWLDLRLYFPVEGYGYYPRPITAPLFFKLAGSNPIYIVALQRIIYSITTFFLAAALASCISRVWLKFVFIICMYLLMSWLNILRWASIPLSESLSTSFLFLWIASFCFWFKKPSKLSLILHLVMMMFLVFSRDSWIYSMLLFYLLISITLVIARNKLFRQSLIALSCSVVFFLILNYSSKLGKRYYTPLINNVLLRIMPNPDYVAWFEKEGMPNAREYQQKYSGLKEEIRHERRRLYDFYYDSANNEFFKWVRENGKNAYMKFLLQHPSYSLLQEEDEQELKNILAYSTFNRKENLNGYSRLASNIFPLFSWQYLIWIFVLLTVAFLYLRDLVFMNVLLLSVMVISNILIVYNADAMEIGRHLYTTNIMIQVLSFWGTALIIDSVQFKKRKLAVDSHSQNFPADSI